jgi:hypothetical protein
MYSGPCPWPIKGKAWHPSKVRFFKPPGRHTHPLKRFSSLLCSQASGAVLRCTPHAHQRLETSVPLSTVCTPYYKLNIELVAQAAMNWIRDVLPEPVYIFASSKLTIRT